MELDLDVTRCVVEAWWPDNLPLRAQSGRDFSDTGARPIQDDVCLYLGMAGTLARFVPALVLNSGHTPPQGVELDGELRLRERPLRPLLVALRQLGARVSGDSLPLRMQPSSLGGVCSISGSESGQFLSGLVLAGAAASKPVTIQRTDNLVQPDYVRMTLEAARAFGAEVDCDNNLNEVRCQPVECLAPARSSYQIEADASTACYLLSLAALFDLDLEVTNLGSSSLQPDLGFVSFLRRMGARFEMGPRSVRHQPRGTVSLQGGFEMDFSLMSDQAITAGVLAVVGSGPVTIRGVAHIRGHESDRIGALVSNLSRLGVTAREHDDGFTVHPVMPGDLDAGRLSAAARHKALSGRLGGVWSTHRDHRFAMTGALLATLSPQLVIESPSCCAKTAPGFFRQLEELGLRFEDRSSEYP
jgi:3-phosphoshikimate 1-carboxyvinyltransferase